MRTITTISLFFLIVFISCTKNNQVNVKYESTGAISEYNLYYTDADGNINNTVVSPESAKDINTISFTGEQGDIVYVSGIYNDPNSALKIAIKIDGKIYKQASNEGDTLKYLTVSGVVPFD